MSKVIVITGASSGIGRAITMRLGAPGNHLILLARRKDVLEKLATLIRNAGAEATVYPIDFLKPGAYQKFHHDLSGKNIVPDEVYHCAVHATAGAVHHTSWEDWQNVYRVNLLAATDILATTYPAMVQRGSGKVILFSSMSCFTGYPMSAPYAATKTALHGVYKSLQYETRRTGVGIHLVCPSFVDTPIFEHFVLRKVTAQQLRQVVLSLRLPITAPTTAANKILEAVNSGKKFIMFPRRVRILAFLIRRFPFLARPYIRRSVSTLNPPTEK